MVLPRGRESSAGRNNNLKDVVIMIAKGHLCLRRDKFVLFDIGRLLSHIGPLRGFITPYPPALNGPTLRQPGIMD